eukprot:m.18912 g.18912  ORF g.18912 m.18912 type:complete len:1153 (+) comp27750_c0_seq3:285-3743(+)
MLICEVGVLSSSDTLVFTLQKKSKGRRLWEEVLKVVSLAEPAYFGLQFTDEYNQKCWLDFNESLGKQVEKTSAWGESVLFEVRVKFWPENPSRIEDDLVKCLMVIQLQESLLENRIKCSGSTLVKIGAYLLQSHVGDVASCTTNYSSEYCLVPQQTPEMEAEMERLHQSDICKGLGAGECDREILKLCYHLDTYGVHFFRALDSAGADGEATEIDVGIDKYGIAVFQEGSRINNFPWIMIKKCSFSDKFFYLDVYSQHDRPTKVGFKMDKSSCKQLWHLFVDFHSFYRLSTSGSKKTRLSRRHLSFKNHSSRKVSSLSSSLTEDENERKEGSGIKLRRSRFGSARRRIVSERITPDRIISATLSRSTSSPHNRDNTLLMVPEESQKSSSDLGFSASGSISSADNVHGDFEDEMDEDQFPSESLLNCDDIPVVDMGELARKLSDHIAIGPVNAYYFIACEIRDTERSYLRDLEFLRILREEIEHSHILLPRQISELFVNLDLIENFHRHFLDELEGRLDYWDASDTKYMKCTIGDIVKRRMACMKIYLNYVTNESRIFELLNQWQSKISDFARICTKFEETWSFRKPVSELFYRPFQRMVHYKELLKRLQKQSPDRNLPDDLADTKEALHYIEDALESVNISTKAAENARKLFRLQRELVGIDNVLRCGRKFIMEGVLLLLGSKGTKPKIFVLFNDLLLCAVKQSSFTGSQLLAEMIYPLVGMKVGDGTDLNEGPYLGFTVTVQSKTVVLIAGSSIEKKVWLSNLENAIQDAEEEKLIEDLPTLKANSMRRNLSARNSITDTFSVKYCVICKHKFGIFLRKRQCELCLKVFCKKCVTNFVRVGQEEKLQRVCDACHLEEILTAKRRDWRKVVISQRRGSGISVTSGESRVQLKRGSCASGKSSNPTLVLPDQSKPTQKTATVVNSHEKLTVTSSFPLAANWAKNTVGRTYSSGASPPPRIIKPTSRVERRMQISPLVAADRSQSEEIMIHKGGKDVGTKLGDMEKKKRVVSTRVLLSLGDSQFSRDTEMSGYLVHKVKARGGWKQFWLVLGSGCLSFYKSHEESQLLFSMALPDYDLSTSEKHDKEDLLHLPPVPCVFKLFTATTVHYFLADNKYTMDRWVEVMVGTVKRCHGFLASLAKQKGFSNRRVHTSH